MTDDTTSVKKLDQARVPGTQMVDPDRRVG
jgi:hypothetical protein